jgi:hypothetical protein
MPIKLGTFLIRTAVRRPNEADRHDASGSFEREAIALFARQLPGRGQCFGEADRAVSAHVEIDIGRDKERAVVRNRRMNRHQADHGGMAARLVEQQSTQGVKTGTEILTFIGDGSAGQSRDAAEDDPRRVACRMRIDNREGCRDADHVIAKL